jgi:transcriptional regulator with XRE-family HTH domain
MEPKNNMGEWLLGDPTAATDLGRQGMLAFKGMSVEQLANASGLARATVYYYISRSCRPSPEALGRICRTLGVPLSEGLSYVEPRSGGRPPSRTVPRITRKPLRPPE